MLRSMLVLGFLVLQGVVAVSDFPELSPNSSSASARVEQNRTEGSALIISGGKPATTAGNSVEVFVPSTGQHCWLPDFSGYARFWHTMEGRTLCGGGVYTSAFKSCLTLTDSGWENSTSLIKERFGHSSWSSPSGLTILMGGISSPRITEKIQEDGTSVRGYDLQNEYDGACAINLGATVLITGGYYSLTIVAEYSEDGYIRDLPQLLQGRRSHGCTYFNNHQGSKTYLVTGGYNGDRLSSTELLEENATNWVLAGELPNPRWGLRVATVDSRVLLTGGTDGGYDGDGTYYDSILEYDPDTREWSQLDRMTVGRYAHALSVIPLAEVIQFCY